MNSQALAPGTELRSSRRTYTIQRVLGQGGFGITYLVETDLRMGNIECTARFAVKEHFIQMLCERDATTNHVRSTHSFCKEVEASKRVFISEAQQLQLLCLNHRHLVKLDDVFEANGTAYYVMEYLDGVSLDEYVMAHGGKLNRYETMAMMQPICDAVAMLHRNHVAHYDIKPQNIMVMTDKQGLRPVLIGFGLAKHYDGQGEATSSIAARGYTPGYAPVEQYAGIQEFSPSADVYALAATIFFCLTGHAPAKASELNRKAVRDELLANGINRSMANVLLKALEYRSVDRIPDATALIAQLYANDSKPELDTDKTDYVPTPGAFKSLITYIKTMSLRRWIISIVGIIILAVVIILSAKGGCGRTDIVQVDTLRIIDTLFYRDTIRLTDTVRVTKTRVDTLYEAMALRTTAQNLDLQVKINGKKYYFNQSDWKRLRSSDKAKCEKIGVVIKYNGLAFVTALHYERTSNYNTRFTWQEARRLFGDRIPSKSYAKAISDQGSAVNSALTTYGGDTSSGYFWTSTPYNNKEAWYYGYYYRTLDHDTKSDQYLVRIIMPLY